MIKRLFGKGPTTKYDVAFAVCGALMAVWKAWDTVTTYKIEQEIKELNA